MNLVCLPNGYEINPDRISGIKVVEPVSPTLVHTAVLRIWTDATPYEFTGQDATDALAAIRTEQERVTRAGSAVPYWVLRDVGALASRAVKTDRRIDALSASVATLERLVEMAEQETADADDVALLAARVDRLERRPLGEESREPANPAPDLFAPEPPEPDGSKDRADIASPEPAAPTEDVPVAPDARAMAERIAWALMPQTVGKTDPACGVGRVKIDREAIERESRAIYEGGSRGLDPNSSPRYEVSVAWVAARLAEFAGKAPAEPPDPIDPDTPRRFRWTAPDAMLITGCYFPMTRRYIDEYGMKLDLAGMGGIEWLDPEPEVKP